MSGASKFLVDDADGMDEKCWVRLDVAATEDEALAYAIERVGYDDDMTLTIEGRVWMCLDPENECRCMEDGCWHCSLMVPCKKDQSGALEFWHMELTETTKNGGDDA